MLVLEKRQCFKCGHTFSHHMGGFIFKGGKAVCPRCGSTVTTRLGIINKLKNFIRHK